MTSTQNLTLAFDLIDDLDPDPDLDPNFDLDLRNDLELGKFILQIKDL